MSHPLHPSAYVVVLAAAALGAGAVAQSTPSVEAAIAQAVAQGTLGDLIATLAKTNSCEFVARAMLDQGVSYDDAIAALLSAEIAPETVSKCLYGAATASEIAALDRALLEAGLPIADTGAGNTGGGTAAPPPFVGPAIGIGGGTSTASSS